MRKLVFGSVVVLGAAVGLASAVGDGAPTAAVMALVGMLIAAPIGAVLASDRVTRSRFVPWPRESLLKGWTHPESLAENFWRDRGNAPFTRPSDAQPDKHMFDPDKLH